MSFTTPQTWTTSQLVTASDLNTDIRDNINFLYAVHGARAYHNTTQSIADIGTTAWTKVALNSEDTENDDTDGYHDNSTNNSRFTIPSGLDGWYHVDCLVQFDNNATGYRRLQIIVDNTTVYDEDRNNSPHATNDTLLKCSCDIPNLAAASYIEMRVQQSSGGALNLNQATPWSPFMSIRWLGAGP